MARSRLFDNIMQVISAKNTIAGTAVVSTEVDFELPRGYVAKIHKIIVFADDITDKLVDAEKDRITYAVILDPDDVLSTGMPEDSVEHDVIMSGTIEYHLLVATGVEHMINYRTEMDFSHLEGLDVLTARNMRFNIVAGAAFCDGAKVGCHIYYTLEQIKDAQIMELLDIL